MRFTLTHTNQRGSRISSNAACLARCEEMERLMTCRCNLKREDQKLSEGKQSNLNPSNHQPTRISGKLRSCRLSDRRRLWRTREKSIVEVALWDQLYRSLSIFLLLSEDITVIARHLIDGLLNFLYCPLRNWTEWNMIIACWSCTVTWVTHSYDHPLARAFTRLIRSKITVSLRFEQM